MWTRWPRHCASAWQTHRMASVRRPRGFFITGTDTGVGKTVVACALAAWYRRHDLDVGVMKPVATGGARLGRGRTSRWLSDDARCLAACAGVDDPWSLVNPVCFREPLAPWTAALRARRSIALRAVLEAFAALRARHDVLIVEGIGGLLVPLTARVTVADLARQLGLPLLLVARPGLGTLNHTLLSLDCARGRSLLVAGIVINHAEPACRDAVTRVTHRTNIQILNRLAGVPVLGSLPFRRDDALSGRCSSAAAQQLSDWIEQHLDRQMLNRLRG